MSKFDVAIVGGGLVGLATGYQLLQQRPELSLVIIDKERSVATHQSSHNSGVIHSGVYYAPGSLKARMCRQGKQALELFANRHEIPFERCGKLIVAVDESEIAGLDALYERARANGVEGVALLDSAELRRIEPHAVGLRAIHVPETGIIDYAQVARAYADDIVTGGGSLFLGRHVSAVAELSDRVVLATDAGEITARTVVTCAGLYSDRFGHRSPSGHSSASGSDDGPAPDERIVPFRGDYYSLAPSARHLCRGLIYPVPDPNFPFLGVHLTKRIDGEVWAGPNAVLAWAREGYSRTTLNVPELVDTLAYRGFRRLARKWWRTGATEMWRDVSKKAFLASLRKYIPELTSADLSWGPSGVRAQAVRRDGSMVDDFSIIRGARSVHVRNAPSPAATASLAIGDHLSRLVLEAVDC